MKLLAKIAALWQRMLADTQEENPSYPLVQEEWELISSAAQARETSQNLGLVQQGRGWVVPGGQA